jgi:phosphatidylcholine synthase
MNSTTIKKSYNIIIAGWLIHLLTASGALIGLWTLQAISQKNIKLALILLTVSIIIDAIDGPLARLLRVKEKIPNFDGMLLDYIVDFFTWIIVPTFLILQTNMFSKLENYLITSAIIISSCYQFCCKDIKSEDNTFKRWPSAWSIVVICIFLWNPPKIISLISITSFVVLSFIPTFFIHSLRLNLFISSNRKLNNLLCIIILTISVFVNISFFAATISYPNHSIYHTYFQIFAFTGYFLISIYRMYISKVKKSNSDKKTRK